jgi:hypothetical protein
MRQILHVFGAPVPGAPRGCVSVVRAAGACDPLDPVIPLSRHSGRRESYDSRRLHIQTRQINCVLGAATPLPPPPLDTVPAERGPRADRADTLPSWP